MSRKGFLCAQGRGVTFRYIAFGGSAVSEISPKIGYIAKKSSILRKIGTEFSPSKTASRTPARPGVVVRGIVVFKL